jgi:hypothetical protein
LVSAAGQLSGLAHHFLGKIEVEQVQLDELYAPTLQLKASEAELLTLSDDSPLWLWTAMDPVSKLLLVALVGQRSLAVAQTVVHPTRPLPFRPFPPGRPLPDLLQLLPASYFPAFAP